MSTSAITSNLLSTDLDTPSTANQFATDLNQLAKDLQSGNVSAAQQDYVTLSQDLENGATSSSAITSSSGITVSLLSNIAGSSSSLSAFTSELNQLGTDLNNGDPSSAQQDMLSLDSTALNAASSTAAATSAAASASPISQAQSATLIRAIVQAMSVGDTSAISAGLSQLASVSTSSQGASVLEQLSSSFGSSSSSSSSASTLLGSLDSSNSSSTTDLLV
jgi:trimeric autotransporter adhesin